MQIYLKRVKELDFLYSEAFELSVRTSGRVDASKKEEIAELIFAKIVLTTRAILKILPNSQQYCDTENKKVWDISSIAILIRGLIESYLVFYYLCIDNISRNEFEFRYKLWIYHSEKEREKMLKTIGSSGERLNNLSKNVMILKENVEKDIFFKKLNKEGKKRAKKYGMDLTNKQIAIRSGIRENYFKAVYSNLSNYVHVRSFSIAQLSKFEVYDSESINVIKVFIEYCIAFLCLSIRDYIKIFTNKKSFIDEKCLDIIGIWESTLGTIF